MGGMFSSCMKTNQIEEEVDLAVRQLEKTVPEANQLEKVSEIDVQQLNFEQTLTEKILQVDFEFYLFQKKDLIDGFYHVLHLLEYDKGLNAIDLNIAKQFSSEICIRYLDNPYHNFHHGFSVFQWSFALQYNYSIYLPVVSKDQFLAHLVSCLAHDVEHPGVNNAFLIAQQHELAKKYNEVSVLENHHAAVLFQLLSQPRTNLFSCYDQNAQKDLRKQIIQSILATDMARHFQILENFQKLNKDYTSPQAKQSFLDFMLHIADISNPTQA